MLSSAVANAVHNDEQDPDELFVVACYADEGPTLRRFRPRAKGRATRIRKRTCHITVVVTRPQRRTPRRAAVPPGGAPGCRSPPSGGTVRSRRDRVERSRTRAQALREGAEPIEGELPEETPAADEGAVDVTEVVADDVADEVVEAEEAEDIEELAAEETELPEGAVLPPEDGSVPEGYPIKGNANSMLYHQPGGRYYDVTIAEVFFDTPEHAEAAGYSAPATEESQS